ncbi:MAG: AraC family transcriptional regulator [Myxococcota bacterium]
MPNQLTEKQPSVLETRNVGWAELTLQQLPPGTYHHAAKPAYRLTVPLQIDCRVATEADESQQATLLPSQLLLTPPRVATKQHFDGPARCLEVAIDAGRVDALAREQDPGFRGFGRAPGAPWRLPRTRDAILQLWRSATGSAPREDAFLPEVVDELLEARGADEMAHRRRALSGVVRRRVVDHIEENLGRSLKLQELAEVARLSPFHFARAFRHDLGLPPRAYVLERRLARAREDILGTRDRLDTISYRVGFSSQQHMTATFRQRHGITPGAIRRRGH